jgi:hypothetical protein
MSSIRLPGKGGVLVAGNFISIAYGMVEYLPKSVSLCSKATYHTHAWVVSRRCTIQYLLRSDALLDISTAEVFANPHDW